jgi:photosystem II protein PsbQ
MRRYRAVVGVLLAVVATFLVSCSKGPAAVAPTYTPEKIAQLQNYVTRIQTARDRLPELARYIEKDNWVNVDNFTHGPLGELRAQLMRLSGQLLPADQPKAKALSEDILGHLQNLDQASQDRNYDVAISQYREFVDDFDAFFSILPEGARTATQKAEEPSRYEKKPSRANFEGIRGRIKDKIDDIPDFDEAREAIQDTMPSEGGFEGIRERIEDAVPDFLEGGN